MIDNVCSILDRATDAQWTAGLYWYTSANALAWELDHVFPTRAAGVIAALSPRLLWDKNVEYARLAYNLKGYDVDVIVNDTPGGNYLPTLNGSALKAMAMVNGAHPRDVLGKGLKTNAFFDNILNPYTSKRVTVDKHAFDIANGERTGYSTIITDKWYRIVEAVYVEAAHVFGIAPLQAQAISWVTWRNMHSAR